MLLAVTTPRFNQNDLGPIGTLTGTVEGGNLGDARHYIRYVDAIRGDVEDLPPAPFRYRPLTPVLAAPLPFSSLTAINIVNVAALGMGTMGVWWILSVLGVDERRRVLGALMFIVSFPTFYYGSIGYVDPLSIAFIVFGTGAVLTDHRMLVLALVVVGSLARETTLLLVPLAIAVLAVRGVGHRRVLAWSAAWIGAFVAATLLIRWGVQHDGTYVWRPSLDRAIENVSRARTWLSAVLTLGVPAAVLGRRAPGFVSLSRDQVVLFGGGILLSVAVFTYSIFSAYSDGRLLWPICAFTVPVAILLLVSPARPDPRTRPESVLPRV